LVIALSVLPIGAGITVAPAAVARPMANAALKTIVFIMLQLSPVSKPSRTHPGPESAGVRNYQPTRQKNGSELQPALAQTRFSAR
jgi:hypothetical protein